MYIYYCDKCKAFESFVGADEEWKCKECGGDLIALGVTIDEWNAMTNDQMLDTIEFAKAEYDKKTKKFDYSDVVDEPKQPKPDVRVDLMECVECFKMISPKSVKCPHCGHFFVNNPKAVRRRKAKRKLSLKILLIGILPAILGGAYEAVILSGAILSGEITLMRATGTMLIYPILYGGCVVGGIGLLMILFGIIGFAKNKPYIKEKTAKNDWDEGIIESGIVIHDESEVIDDTKEVIKPVEKVVIEEKIAVAEKITEDSVFENDEDIFAENSEDAVEDSTEVNIEISVENSAEVIGDDAVENSAEVNAEDAAMESSIEVNVENATEDSADENIENSVEEKVDSDVAEESADIIDESAEKPLEETATEETND